MNRKFILVFLLITPAFVSPVFSQDFGFDDGGVSDGAFSSSFGAAENVFGVKVSGEVSALLLGYIDDFSNGADNTRLGNVFSGKLNFAAGNSFGDAVINLKLSTDSSMDPFPLSFDEAYARVYFGDFEIEGGLRKLTWGKADSLGPLDVINPLDNREITDISDILNIKIARPLIHATARIGRFSKLEGVFVPVFAPASLALSGRWAPFQIAGLPVQPLFPDMSTLDYAQAGLRFTTTVGSSDIGAQYYYGRLTKPVFKVSIAPDVSSMSIEALYNSYHQIGLDYAGVIAGFNLRAECAANITGDSEGDDGLVYNPHLLWSLGFDRDLVLGVNVNLQCNETVRLLYDEIGEDPMLDMEADADVTFTQVTAILSKKFLRDELEARLAAIWGVEDGDFFVVPAVIWNRDAVQVEFSGGVFGGADTGQFGQYHKNSFIKLELSYTF
ncbi:MAG: hypothetical protein LBJ35_05485 [Spirochaetaceae bacterium]|jgi:hypothetical protein|nr:hypothetical protein [Spirochaetaceae bacterium]